MGMTSSASLRAGEPYAGAMHHIYPTALTSHTHSMGSQTTLEAVPQFGGNSTNTVSSWSGGFSRVPTPRELVEALDQYVIGQPQAKRVSHVLVAAVETGRAGKWVFRS